MQKITLYIKHLVPWCVAAGIFVYLFHRYPPAQVWHALSFVNLPAFAGFALFYFFFIFAVDAGVMQYVMGRFSHRVRYGDLLRGRGVTYLIMVLSYPASQAAFAYYLKRRCGVPIFEALGVFLFIVVIDLLWIISLALAGSFFQDYVVAGIDIGVLVRHVAIGAYIGALIWIGFWNRWLERLTGRRLRWAWLERIRARRVFHIFNQAGLLDYVKVALLRTPIHLTIIISMWVVLHTFGAEIPFGKILGNIPIVFFVGTLPIAPGGLGTTNAMMVEMLSPYLSGSVFASGRVSPEELLFAATLLWMFANYLLKIFTGVFLLRRTSRDLFKPTADVPEAVAEEEAAPIGGNV